METLVGENMYPAVFVNVSRSQTVQDNPLLKMRNVVTIPHIGSATARTEAAMAMRAAENLVAVLTKK